MALLAVFPFPGVKDATNFFVQSNLSNNQPTPISIDRKHHNGYPTHSAASLNPCPGTPLHAFPQQAYAIRIVSADAMVELAEIYTMLQSTALNQILVRYMFIVI